MQLKQKAARRDRKDIQWNLKYVMSQEAEEANCGLAIAKQSN